MGTFFINFVVFIFKCVNIDKIDHARVNCSKETRRFVFSSEVGLSQISVDI